MLNKAFNLQKKNKSAYAHTLNSIPVLMVAEISLSTLFGYSFYSRKLRNLGRVIIWPDFIILSTKKCMDLPSQVTLSKWIDESFEILSEIGINLFSFDLMGLNKLIIIIDWRIILWKDRPLTLAQMPTVQRTIVQFWRSWSQKKAPLVF